MNLLVDAIANEVDEMHANGVRLHTIGDIQGLPGNCYQSLLSAMERTKDNTSLTLVLALNYSARQEILKAAVAAHQLIEDGQLSVYYTPKIFPIQNYSFAPAENAASVTFCFGNCLTQSCFLQTPIGPTFAAMHL
jgi:hypothetical protein